MNGPNVVPLAKPVNEKAVGILRDALRRAECGEISDVTVLLEDRGHNIHTNWSGSDDLMRVLAHLSRLQFVVNKRLSGDYD